MLGNKIKIVACISNPDLNGLVGKIIEPCGSYSKNQLIAVEFNRPIYDGHSAGGLGKLKHCYLIDLEYTEHEMIGD